MRRVVVGVVCLLILGVSGALVEVAGSSFSQITLADILQTPLSTQRINGSDNAMNEIPTGTILMYQTNEGRYGVLEIASYGRDLILNWRTHPNAGENVLRSGKGLVVHGTWQCDLDQGVEGSLSADFRWKMVNSVERYIEPLNGAKFGFPLPSVPGGVFAPQPTERVAYSVSPPRSIEVVIPKVKLYFDLQTDLPWNQRESTQWGVCMPQPGTSDPLCKTVECSSCGRHYYLKDWQFKPSTYWPHATQYLISDPTPGHWDNFALCMDVPYLTWGTAVGYNVSLVRASTFSSFRKGRGVVVPSSQKVSIAPTPILETGPMHAKGGVGVRSPYEACITFPQVSLEWFRWSGKAHLRVGDMILKSNLGWQWDSTNPNAIKVWVGWGIFLMDLATRSVTYVDAKSSTSPTSYPTLLTVAVDDGPGDMIPFGDPYPWR